MPQESPDKPAVLQYGRPVPRRHRGFLPDSPFWRNWLFGLFLIGFGVIILPSPNDPQDMRLVCYGFMIAGALVIIASVLRAVGVFLGKWHD
jgi:hypothetical protein